MTVGCEYLQRALLYFSQIKFLAFMHHREETALTNQGIDERPILTGQIIPDVLLLIPRLRPRRLDGTGPNVIPGKFMVYSLGQKNTFNRPCCLPGEKRSRFPRVGYAFHFRRFRINSRASSSLPRRINVLTNALTRMSSCGKNCMPS